MRIEGRIMVLKDAKGDLLRDIDTDQIYHNKHLAVTDVREMGKYALGNLKGYEDLPKRAGTVDIIVAGENFGAGSSRQQAVDCFKSLNIKALLVRSIGAIYKRNAINAALAMFSIEEGAQDLARSPDGSIVSIDTETCEISLDGKRIGSIAPPSKVQMEILGAGGLFEYGRRLADRAMGSE